MNPEGGASTSYYYYWSYSFPFESNFRSQLVRPELPPTEEGRPTKTAGHGFFFFSFCRVGVCKRKRRAAQQGGGIFINRKRDDRALCAARSGTSTHTHTTHTQHPTSGSAGLYFDKPPTHHPPDPNSLPPFRRRRLSPFHSFPVGFPRAVRNFNHFVTTNKTNERLAHSLTHLFTTNNGDRENHTERGRG